MSKLKKQLEELAKVEGINSAIVVGRDGFVIDGVANGAAMDTEAVGAVVSTGIGSSEVMGRELNVGDMTQAMLEYDGGIIVTSFLGMDAILAVVADLKANLGMVRYQVKKRIPDILKAL
ncbi:roadblock/LC7 domain-containing protein [candidate division KSB1 bacterium]|nr:roadblock/LC7 domain-containing protein [candidate division KSB1 bacterium]